MSTLSIVRGDATAPAASGAKIVAHVCNDIGAWGRGFVVAVSSRWPAAEAEYRRWYRERESNDFGLGAVQLVPVAQETWVANMVAQHGIRRSRGRPPIRYDALRNCLSALAEKAASMDASVHMPRIGCGLAGGTWAEVEPIIVDTLGARAVPVTVYDLV